MVGKPEISVGISDSAQILFGAGSTPNHASNMMQNACKGEISGRNNQ